MTYLYLLQKSQTPSQELMRGVLDWWKRDIGRANFQMLGGQQADHVPSTADMYVMGILFAIRKERGFTNRPENLGYSTITVGQETIGVCRFIK